MRGLPSTPKGIISGSPGHTGIDSPGVIESHPAKCNASPPWAISYGASKAALNLSTLELSRREENKVVMFQCTSPGHCKTDFNNNTGFKDPTDRARVIAGLVLEERGRSFGLWEIEGGNIDPVTVPW